MIRRRPQETAGSAYDLIVIGGGIYGVALTLQAARRGLRPVLLERGDFGAGTSWNSLRIVHGGLRYLQSFDLPRFRESVADRRWLLRHFPEQVHILPCLMPLHGRGLRRPGVLRLALAVNDLLSWRRNRGVAGESLLPPGRVLSAEETLALCPLVPRPDLEGAALWYDGFMPDSQRLLIEMLHWATACGAVALNYVEARRLLAAGRTVSGVRATDRESGESLDFRAPCVVNCAGPWCRQVAARLDRDRPELFHRSLAFNALLSRRPSCEVALAVTPPRPGAGTYFLVPWKDKLLAGTYHAAWTGDPAGGQVDEALLSDFLDDLNAGVPGLGLDRSEVVRVHWGFLPALAEGVANLAVRAALHHHGDDGGPHGLFSVSGVKFTTARSVAEKTLRLIRRRLGVRLAAPAPRPGPAPPPPAAEEFQSLVDSSPRQAAERLREIEASESVVHLDDLVLRRTDWGVDPLRGMSIAAKVAPLLGWDQNRISRELATLEKAIR